MGLFRRLLGESSSPVARVRMIASVDSHVAGEQYDLPLEIADRYIVRGYAEGNLSREFSDDEMLALRGNPQVVGL
jgi:hypothetical protein